MSITVSKSLPITEFVPLLPRLTGHTLIRLACGLTVLGIRIRSLVLAALLITTALRLTSWAARLMTGRPYRAFLRISDCGHRLEIRFTLNGQAGRIW